MQKENKTGGIKNAQYQKLNNDIVESKSCQKRQNLPDEKVYQ